MLGGSEADGEKQNQKDNEDNDESSAYNEIDIEKRCLFIKNMQKFIDWLEE